MVLEDIIEQVLELEIISDFVVEHLLSLIKDFNQSVKTELFLRLFLIVKNKKDINFDNIVYFMTTLFFCYRLQFDFHIGFLSIIKILIRNN